MLVMRAGRGEDVPPGVSDQQSRLRRGGVEVVHIYFALCLEFVEEVKQTERESSARAE